MSILSKLFGRKPEAPVAPPPAPLPVEPIQQPLAADIGHGSMVRLIQPVVEGRVVERRFHAEHRELEVLVEWFENGHPTRQWFDADRLEEVK